MVDAALFAPMNENGEPLGIAPCRWIAAADMPAQPPAWYWAEIPGCWVRYVPESKGTIGNMGWPVPLESPRYWGPFFGPTDSVVRHVASGGEYAVQEGPITARLEATASPAYIYRGADGLLWARAADQMEDGRFETIPKRGASTRIDSHLGAIHEQ